ncbi:MAG: class I SAM-dependent methyltransferase [Sphingobacteriales bacterium]|nr:class I SAM-dependent methyltransferase [Sphingobacteriales bacterium]
MTETAINIQEQKAKEAFNRQAPLFDELYGRDSIVQYKRKRVREHVEKFILPDSFMLELNAGTGEDAVYFAGRGHSVHATDISPAMNNILMNKRNESRLADKITHELCSFTQLNKLQQQGPFDYIFSNFAGLNCIHELAKVLASFQYLLKPGGYITMVILPPFCLWEFLLLFKGKFKTALRRFSGRKGTEAHIEGEYFRCWYYSPSFIRKHLKNEFEVMALEGLCTFVPPSYMERFTEKHPKLYRRLVRCEEKWKSKWPWKIIGDYYIITLQKK